MVKKAISDAFYVNKVCSEQDDKSFDKNQNVMASKQSGQKVCTDTFNITLYVNITK